MGISWVHSPSGSVLVVAEEKSFRVSRELLRKRSPVFTQRLQTNFDEDEGDLVTMPDIGQRAFRAFFQWSYSDTRRLKPDMSLEDGLDMAELAQKYQLYGLKNQVLDLT